MAVAAAQSPSPTSHSGAAAGAVRYAKTMAPGVANAATE